MLTTLDKLKIGANEPVLFTPFLGEFGHELMTAVRLIHFHPSPDKYVCCKKGEETLYPSAACHITDWVNPFPDAVVVGTQRQLAGFPHIFQRYPNAIKINPGNLDILEEFNVLNPEQLIHLTPRLRGVSVDFVLGCRNRQQNRPDRTWPKDNWQRIADFITKQGYTFGQIGLPATTLKLDNCKVFATDLDQCIELLHNCGLYVGTDTGTSHLAALAQCNMVVFKHFAGRDFIPVMRKVNHNRLIELNAWNEPEKIISAIDNYIRAWHLN